MLVARHHNLHEIHFLNNRLQLCRTDVNTGIPTLALMSARAADIAPSPIIRRSVPSASLRLNDAESSDENARHLEHETSRLYDPTSAVTWNVLAGGNANIADRQYTGGGIL